MLLLLDIDGHVVWKESGVASDPDVFDLEIVEMQIRTLMGTVEVNLEN
jgi:hypothetical protein